MKKILLLLFCSFSLISMGIFSLQNNYQDQNSEQISSSVTEIIVESKLMKQVGTAQVIDAINNNQVLENISVEKLSLTEDISHDIQMKNCEIKELSLWGTFGNVIFDGCKIDSLIFMGAFFPKGFTIKNSHIMSETYFTSGGYNLKNSEIIIRDNIFEKGVSFNDSNFTGPFLLLNNQFKEGTDILFKTQLEPSFDVPPVIEGNSGELNVDIISRWVDNAKKTSSKDVTPLIDLSKRDFSIVVELDDNDK